MPDAAVTLKSLKRLACVVKAGLELSFERLPGFVRKVILSRCVDDDDGDVAAVEAAVMMTVMVVRMRVWVVVVLMVM